MPIGQRSELNEAEMSELRERRRRVSYCRNLPPAGGFVVIHHNVVDVLKYRQSQWYRPNDASYLTPRAADGEIVPALARGLRKGPTQPSCLDNSCFLLDPCMPPGSETPFEALMAVGFAVR
jgi:hypothetical protein